MHVWAIETENRDNRRHAFLIERLCRCVGFFFSFPFFLFFFSFLFSPWCCRVYLISSHLISSHLISSLPFFSLPPAAACRSHVEQTLIQSSPQSQSPAPATSPGHQPQSPLTQPRQLGRRAQFSVVASHPTGAHHMSYPVPFTPPFSRQAGLGT